MSIPERWQQDKKGSDLTSMKVGGPLQYFSRPRTEDELREDLRTAKEMQLPLRMIGGGSNLIISDEGFNGLAVQPAFTELTVLTAMEGEKYASFLKEKEESSAAVPRYQPGDEEGMLELNEADIPTEEGDMTLVRLGAGVPWGQAVMWSLTQQLIGLHWYARIPCQVGGAIFNNIHGGTHLLSESVVAVEAIDTETGEKRLFGPSELQFGYDFSRFHQRGEVITAAVFALQKVTSPTAEQCKQLYLGWTAEKTKVQPSGANCGSVFQNISAEKAREIGQTPLAAAWYIDQCGLRGSREGGMQVYEKHANFIINTGDGTQADFISLVRRIRQTVNDRFGVMLEPEAECIDSGGNRLVW